MNFLRMVMCVFALAPLAVIASDNSNSGTTLIKLEGTKSKGFYFGYVATSLRGEDLAAKLVDQLKLLCESNSDFSRAKLFIYKDGASAMRASMTRGDLPNIDDPAWRSLQEAYLGQYDRNVGLLRLRINGQERVIKVGPELCEGCRKD